MHICLCSYMYVCIPMLYNAKSEKKEDSIIIKRLLISSWHYETQAETLALLLHKQISDEEYATGYHGRQAYTLQPTQVM